MSALPRRRCGKARCWGAAPRRPFAVVRLVGTMLAAVACVAACGAPTDPPAEPAPQETIARAARAVVKVYGAGGVRSLEGYQSGILVSPDGRVATAMSTVLDTDAIECVLDDGSRHVATLVGVDPRRELALLKIDATGLPHFDLERSSPAAVGTRVIALSNLFGVAVGDERVSAQRGVVAARVPLEARRGAAEAPYSGEVYILDCTTNNPGSAGGALVDARGRLVGLLGKELRSTTSGIWLSYALPAAEVARGLAAIASGEPSEDDGRTVEPFDPLLLGAVLVPDLLDRTPPFVEGVVRGSVAERAGLQPDDLVIAVGGRSVGSRAAVHTELGRLAAGDPVRLAVIRAGEIVAIDLGPKPRSESRSTERER